MTGTISGRVYAQLRGDILAAALPPGGKLRVQEVCARYGVTSTPMREALNQLASEGLVRRWEQRGLRVVSASVTELAELTGTRCWVEGLALHEAIACRSAGWEAGLREAWAALSETPRSTDRSSAAKPGLDDATRLRIERQNARAILANFA